MSELDEDFARHMWGGMAEQIDEFNRSSTRSKTERGGHMAVTTAGPPKAAAPAIQSKMKLDSLVRGRLKQPKRIVMTGVEGIGKSTFGANAPHPVFIGAEDGTAQLDVARFPAPQSWQDIRDAVRELTTGEHDFKTAVFDTLDWMEPLLWAHICKRDGMANIEAYGYGKGYQAALDEWRVFLADLERLRAAKGMEIILIAHTWIRTFKNPEGEDFDRYEMKIHAKAAGLIKEWADVVLFANYETFAQKKDERAKKAKGISTGARLIFTERHAAYDAKNRFGLPPSLPLSYADFAAAVEAGTDVPALQAEIRAKAKQLGGDVEVKVLETLAKAGDSAASLAVINNRLNTRLAEMAAKEQQ